MHTPYVPTQPPDHSVRFGVPNMGGRYGAYATMGTQSSVPPWNAQPVTPRPVAAAPHAAPGFPVDDVLGASFANIRVRDHSEAPPQQANASQSSYLPCMHIDAHWNEPCESLVEKVTSNTGQMTFGQESSPAVARRETPTSDTLLTDDQLTGRMAALQPRFLRGMYEEVAETGSPMGMRNMSASEHGAVDGVYAGSSGF
ncbi:hypothetical protein BU23DRAFT_563431 [Bimuria novae-zelandiae CBS 107.79]|uniref:Uncharacterized protein n=1 Tax=Bimuria novae-zelandiae CBS 107.79 TaxID=1447943 RepID=A0A6A5VU36_9PLEO|nr:hypothetical protein BU23DRAFT_563431 [Bimuria novae-zelandiae CBS 107.79]